jgi:hypothetical protein
MHRAKIVASPVYIVLLLLAHGLIGQGSPASLPALLMKSGTPVHLELEQTISSAHAHQSDRLEFSVVKDVVVGGFTVIRTGALAKGSVVRVKGKRPLGMGGEVTVRLDSVVLTNGQSMGLVARREYKGKSRTFRMGMEIALAGAIYWPSAPVFLLSRGRDSTVLKGAEVTAFTRDDSSLETKDFPRARVDDSELSETIKLLPPQALDGEGHQGDMINMMFLAKENDLKMAFARAGWIKPDKSIPRIVWRLMWQRTHYTKLPMYSLYVYGRVQDYSFVLPDPNSIVAQRHHLRIWKTGGEVDGVPLWAGAATHDVSIKFVKHTFHIFHRIDPNVDAERDFIAADLSHTLQFTREEYMDCAKPVFNSENATGQKYYSDSRMLVLELNGKAAPLAGTTEVAGSL